MFLSKIISNQLVLPQFYPKSAASPFECKLYFALNHDYIEDLNEKNKSVSIFSLQFVFYCIFPPMSRNTHNRKITNATTVEISLPKIIIARLKKVTNQGGDTGKYYESLKKRR